MNLTIMSIEIHCDGVTAPVREPTGPGESIGAGRSSGVDRQDFGDRSCNRQV